MTMRLTHPDGDEMVLPNTTTAAAWAKTNGWQNVDDDVKLLDPADHPEPPVIEPDPDAPAG